MWGSYLQLFTIHGSKYNFFYLTMIKYKKNTFQKWITSGSSGVLSPDDLEAGLRGLSFEVFSELSRFWDSALNFY